MKKIILVVVIFFVGSPLFAQGLSPLVQVIHANKKGEASGSFAITNSSIRPLVSLLDVRPIGIVDDTGRLAPIPAKADERLMLNTSSVNVPPRAQSIVDFKTFCPATCAFMVLTGDSTTERRNAEGLLIRLVIAETIYVEREPIRKNDAQVSWMDSKTLLIQNTGDGFGRPDIDVKVDGKTIPLPSFPVMPHSKRIVEVPEHSEVILQFEKFKTVIKPQ